MILRGFLHVEVPKENIGHFINSELQNTIADLAEIVGAQYFIDVENFVAMSTGLTSWAMNDTQHRGKVVMKVGLKCCT